MHRHAAYDIAWTGVQSAVRNPLMKGCDSVIVHSARRKTTHHAEVAKRGQSICEGLIFCDAPHQRAPVRILERQSASGVVSCPGQVLDRHRSRHVLGLTGNVLDVGCGGTCHVPAGPTPFGIEISAALAFPAAPAFAARGGSVVHASAVEGIDTFADAFFSAILMRSYLEHEAQPGLALQKAFRKLAPAGKVFVRVPDYGSINRRVSGKRWCGFRFPDHVNYFTGRSLRRLAESTGFTYRRINWLSPFDDNIIAILTRR